MRDATNPFLSVRLALRNPLRDFIPEFLAANRRKSQSRQKFRKTAVITRDIRANLHNIYIIYIYIYIY